MEGQNLKPTLGQNEYDGSSDSDVDSSYDLLPAPSVAVEAPSSAVPKGGLVSKGVGNTPTMEQPVEPAKCEHTSDDKDKEIARLREEIDRMRQQMGGEKEATATDGVDQAESLKEKTRLENRMRFIKYIKFEEDVNESRTTHEKLHYFMLWFDLFVIVFSLFFTMLQISNQHTNVVKICQLVFPAFMTFYNLFIGWGIYYVQGPGFDSEHSRQRVIAQAIMIMLNCVWAVFPSTHILHFYLAALKFALIMFSAWKIADDRVKRMDDLRCLAESAADYSSMAPAASSDSEEAAIAAAAASGDNTTEESAADGRDEEKEAEAPLEEPFFLELETKFDDVILDADTDLSVFPYVDIVIPRGSAERSGVLKSGHEILSINGVSLENATDGFVYEMLEKVKGPAKFELRFNPKLVEEY